MDIYTRVSNLSSCLLSTMICNSSAHTVNGTYAAGKQTSVAVKTDNGIKSSKKATVGAYRNKKE